jgi:hypothetical protein
MVYTRHSPIAAKAPRTDTRMVRIELLSHVSVVRESKSWNARKTPRLFRERSGGTPARHNFFVGLHRRLQQKLGCLRQPFKSHSRLRKNFRQRQATRASHNLSAPAITLHIGSLNFRTRLCSLYNGIEADMRSLVLGPFVALLPKRWRESLVSQEFLNWRSAVILSGLLEFTVALAAMVVWYSYSVTGRAEKAVYSAAEHGAHIAPGTEGFAAFAIMWLHPLTWLIAYFGVEGVVRLCAAFTDTVLGLLFLFLLDKAFIRLSPQKAGELSYGVQFPQNHVVSAVAAVRQKLLQTKLPIVPDELCSSSNASGELLEIRSCRAIPGWTPPRVICYEGSYYSLETSAQGTPPRPFVYSLRKLSAGLPSRTVLSYSPEQPPIRTGH